MQVFSRRERGLQVKLWIDGARLAPEGYNLTARTADEAVRIIGLGGVTRISIDCEADYIGYAVAKVIERLAYDGRIKRIKCLVHGDDPLKRKRIHASFSLAEESWDRIDCEEDYPFDLA